MKTFAIAMWKGRGTGSRPIDTDSRCCHQDHPLARGQYRQRRSANREVQPADQSSAICANQNRHQYMPRIPVAAAGQFPARGRAALEADTAAANGRWPGRHQQAAVIAKKAVRGKPPASCMRLIDCSSNQPQGRQGRRDRRTAPGCKAKSS